MLKNLIISAITAGFCLLSQLAYCADIQISNAILRAPLPGAVNTAAFMTIENHSDQAVKLLAAQTTVAQTVELHTHRHEDGVMRMRQVDFIEIPAHGSQLLQSGGYHLMLLGVTSMTAMQQVEITLEFDNQQRYLVTATVQEMMPQHHH